MPGGGWTSRGRAVGKPALAAAAISFGLLSGLGCARGLPADSQTVALAELPVQARQTHHLILGGGPFPYEKDGTVFFNRERQLPQRARGFYREYTVKTPGLRDRGARRIVCGGPEPRQPVACYYTVDHYASFRRIVP